MTLDVLVAIGVAGAAAAGLGALVRASPWPAAWLGRKPLSCVACMAGHASWVVLLASWAAGAWEFPGIPITALTWLGSTGVASVLLAQTGLFVQGFDLHTTDGAAGGETGWTPPHGP